MKITKILSIFVLIFALVLSLASCDLLKDIPVIGDLIGGECEEHVDENADGLCDACEICVGEHVDANCDGKINAIDARLVLRISAKLEPYPAVDTAYFKNADINGDGVLTAADARIILRCSAGLANPKDYENTQDLPNK